jgi:lipoprotein-anchoring transpeptidase ErfK/SrfK
MMGKRISRAVIVLTLCVVFSAMFTGVAFAVDSSLVPNHAIVGSVDLYGMTLDEARATISREASVTLLPPLRVKSAGKYFSLEASKCLVLDVDSMLARACTPTVDTTITLSRSCVVSAAPVAAFTKRVAKGIYRSKRNAYYYVNKYQHLKWKKAVYGRSLYPNAAVYRVTRELAAEAASGTVRPTLTLGYKTYTPTITDKKLGRAILVDLSQRKLRLFDHSDMIKKVGVCIGMPGHRTPRGTFKIIAKAKNPAWYNPGSDWAANMPSYIPPGTHNPLGVRALYLNVPGIRIHGTYKTWSIGHAESHGCMRVANSQIVKLYPLVPVGTKVFIIK